MRKKTDKEFKAQVYKLVGNKYTENVNSVLEQVL